MEFYRIVRVKTSEKVIKGTLNIEQPEIMSSQFFLLEPMNDYMAKIGSFWGEFTLNKQNIKGGLRFSLLECPNALAWTVTTGYDPEPEYIMVHLTINRTAINQEFQEEIDEFLDDQVKMLENTFYCRD